MIKKPPIKYREAIYAQPYTFVGWHYWGWINGEWEEPESSIVDNSFPYVGLKDKHLNEIYVGDIIKYVNREADHIPVLVIWDEDYLQYCVEEIWSNYACRGDLWDSEFIREKSRVKINVCVLGNIVENPDYKERFKPRMLGRTKKF